MTEQINKQCRFCGEYIPLDATKCQYCGEILEEIKEEQHTEAVSGVAGEVKVSSDVQENYEQENIKSNSKNSSVVKYVVIGLVTFIVGVIIVLLILFFVNRNNDVTIAPTEKQKPAMPKILDSNSADNMEQAKSLYKAGKIEEAALKFQDEIDLYNDPVAYYYLGEIYRDGGYTKIAISNYKKSMDFKKDFYEPMKRLADIYVQKGDNEQALEYAEKAIKQKQNDLELLKTVAKLYQNIEDDENAVEYSQKVVKLDSKDYDSNYYLANYYYDKEEYKQAVPYFKNLLSIGYDTQTAYLLAISYSKIEYYTNAMEILDLIMEKDPYEYSSALYAKSRVADMKDYYYATHKQVPVPNNVPRSNRNSYDDEAEDALF